MSASRHSSPTHAGTDNPDGRDSAAARPDHQPTYRLHLWGGILLAAFFLGWWWVLQAPRPLPASPDGGTAASVVRTARVRHPPAPESGRGALPADLVVMTVTYPADRASPAPAGTIQALRVLLPAHYAHHPALQQDALLQLTLDERRSPPPIRHIATAHEPSLVPGPTLHDAALRGQQHSRGTAHLMLLAGLGCLAVSLRPSLRLRLATRQCPRDAQGPH